MPLRGTHSISYSVTVHEFLAFYEYIEFQLLFIVVLHFYVSNDIPLNTDVVQQIYFVKV